MLIFVLAWIAFGLGVTRWLIYRPGDDTPTLMVIFIFVYFAVPIIFAGVVR